MTLQEHIELDRWKLRHFFTKRELQSKAARNPITKASLIEKHHALHFKEVYPFGVPSNLIQPQTIVAIIKTSK